MTEAEQQEWLEDRAGCFRDGVAEGKASVLKLVNAEIERMHLEAVMAAIGNQTDWLRSRVATCVDIISFLDTIEEKSEKPNNHEGGVTLGDNGYVVARNPNIHLEGLDEAAENYIAPIENDAGLDFINFSGRDIRDAFKAGAEWRDKQGILTEQIVDRTPLNGPNGIMVYLHDFDGFKPGDKVIVQIRKK